MLYIVPKNSSIHFFFACCLLLCTVSRAEEPDLPKSNNLVLCLEKSIQQLNPKLLEPHNLILFKTKSYQIKQLKHIIRCAPWLYDEELATDTRIKILLFDKLNLRSQKDLLTTLRKFNKPKARLLASLHTGVIELHPTLQEKGLIHLSLKRAIHREFYDKKLIIKDFDTSGLALEVLGDIINLGADRRVQAIDAIYSDWLKLYPNLRYHLGRQSYTLELDRLTQAKQRHQVLDYLMGINRSDVIDSAAIHISRWPIEDLKFSPDTATTQQALAYLTIIRFNRKSKPEQREKKYLKLSQSIPDLATALPNKIRFYETERLLTQGKFYEAFAFATSKANAKYFSIDYGHKSLGTWAAKKPDKLIHGLPEIDTLLKVYGSDFLDAYSKDFKTANHEERLAIAKKFQVLLEKSKTKDAWIGFARYYHAQFYGYTFLVRNDLPTALSELEKIDRIDLQFIGDLLFAKPELVKQIQPEAFQTSTLKQIMASFCPEVVYDKTDFLKKLLFAQKLLERWQAAHPDLLKKSNHSDFFLIEATHLWQQGQYQKAIALLDSNNKPRLHLNYNPSTLDLALEMARRMSISDVTKHFMAESVSSEFISALLEYTRDSRTSEPALIRLTVEAQATLRDRNKKDLMYRVEFNKERKLAYKKWKQGDTELAYQISQNLFWHDSHFDEDNISFFPQLAYTLDKIEEAIKDAPNFAPTAQHHSLKLAYLLREAGRLEEARKLASIDPQSNIFRMLCIETDHFQEAADAYALADNQRKKNRLYQWLTHLDKITHHLNAKTPSRRNSDNPVSFLPYQDIKKFYEKEHHKREWASPSYLDAKYKAWEHDLITFCENKLIATAATQDLVSLPMMKNYYNFAPYLPNKDLGAMIAMRLGSMEKCFPGYQSKKGEEKWGHKIFAYKALTSLGNEALASEHLKLILKDFIDHKDLSFLPKRQQHVLMKGIVYPVTWGRVELLKVAQLSLPDANLLEKISYLRAHFTSPDRLVQIQQLIEIVRKNKQHFSRDERINLVRFFQKSMHQHYKSTAEMQKEKGVPLDSLKIHMGNVRQTFTCRSDMLRKNKLQIISPKPGSNFNPKNENFVALDGVHKAYQYWLAGDHMKAKNQLRDISLRFILDSSLLYKSYRFKYSDSREINSAGGTGANFPLAIMACTSYGMPLEITHKMLRTMERLPHEGIRNEEDFIIGRYYIAEGAYEQARRLSLLSDSFAHMAQIHGTWIIKAIEENDYSRIRYHLDQSMRLDPYDTRVTIVALEKLLSKNELAVFQNIDDFVTQFWQEKLKSLPDYPLYIEALNDWKNQVNLIKLKSNKK